ncbi:MAG: hypothetical protein LAO79_19670 [Acidobacteriia bacterium]|nr:hypothetical protein [Terriglobia bacterium]
MFNLRFSPLPVVLALSSLCSSCLFKKSPRSFTPPPPQSQPRLPTTQPVVTSPPPLIAGDPSGNIPSAPATIPEIPAPPAPKPPVRGRPVPTQPKPAQATPPAEQPPPPRLGQIFAPEELRQYNRAIDDSLNRVKRALEILAHKSLNPDQQVEVSRIATFQKQAEQARDAQDMLTAVSLAQRADTLAQDLLGRVP